MTLVSNIRSGIGRIRAAGGTGAGGGRETPQPGRTPDRSISPDTDIVLHIGAHKCGSSSLQRALNTRPVFQSQDGSRTFRYIAIRPGGIVLPDPLREKAIGSGQTSNGWNKFLADATNQTRLDGFLADMRQRAITPVISSEGIFHILLRSPDTPPISNPGLHSSVFFYIRPQVELLNSAWLQWGVWQGLAFERWLAWMSDQYWDDTVLRLKKISWISELHINTVAADVVGDFFGVLGVAPPQDTGKRINRTRSVRMISFLLRHRQYRPGSHDSRADYILERYPDAAPYRLPWCFTRQQTAEIIERHFASNLRLRDLLPANVWKGIARDARCWDATAYPAAPTLDWTDPPLPEDPEDDRRIIAFLAENGLTS